MAEKKEKKFELERNGGKQGTHEMKTITESLQSAVIVFYGTTHETKISSFDHDKKILVVFIRVGLTRQFLTSAEKLIWNASVSGALTAKFYLVI